MPQIKHLPVSHQAGTLLSDEQVPLCVDLDETVIRTGLLWEIALSAIRQNILLAVLLPLWLFRGRAYLKARLAQVASLDILLLPYDSEALAFLRQQWQSGREVILATGTDREIAERVAQYLGVFSSVIAIEGFSGKQRRARSKLRFRGASTIWAIIALTRPFGGATVATLLRNRWPPSGRSFGRTQAWFGCLRGRALRGALG